MTAAEFKQVAIDDVVASFVDDRAFVIADGKCQTASESNVPVGAIQMQARAHEIVANINGFGTAP